MTRPLRAVARAVPAAAAAPQPAQTATPGPAERVAIESARTLGYGNSKHFDRIAVEAMRHEIDSPAINGALVIGEAELEVVRQ